MRPEELKLNRILRDPIFPERVQIIVQYPVGDSVKLVGIKGLQSGKVYRPILSAQQLAGLTSPPDREPFGGDPQMFRLGIEAMPLQLAYEYDPYFSRPRMIS